MDPISLAAGAIILAIGSLGGFVVGRVTGRTKTSPPPSLYTCTCDHPLSAHDPKTGRCADQVWRRGSFDVMADWDKCPCRQYVGERPLTELDPSQVLRNIQESP
jgi:hypothetical protein